MSNRLTSKRLIIVKKGHDIECTGHILQIEQGWVYSYKILPDGEVQILEIHLPSDLINVEACLEICTKEVLYKAVTDVYLSNIPTSQWPDLSKKFLENIFKKRELFIDQFIMNNKKNANERISSFFTSLYSRVGKAKKIENGMICPLTQNDVSNILGITSIHLNRSLNKLKEDGVLVFHSGVVRFLKKFPTMDFFLVLCLWRFVRIGTGIFLT